MNIEQKSKKYTTVVPYLLHLSVNSYVKYSNYDGMVIAIKYYLCPIIVIIFAYKFYTLNVATIMGQKRTNLENKAKLNPVCNLMCGSFATDGGALILELL